MPLATPSGGLEELVDASSGRDVMFIPPVVDRFEDLTKKYEHFLVDKYVSQEWLKDNVTEALLPSDINLFLQSNHEYENDASYNYDTGFFISQLIQNSYTAGNNDFEFDMSLLKPVNFIASHIFGMKKQMIRVVIAGEVGNECGYGAGYSTYTIQKASNRCGQFAEHSTFTIEEVGDECGWGSKHSTFQTHNSEQYDKFQGSVSPSEGNTIYLLAPDGSILKGGKW